MAEQNQTRRVIIKVDSGNSDQTIKSAAKEFAKLNQTAKNVDKSVKGVSSTLSVFRNALTFSIAGIGLREIARAADSFQLLRDRISVFVGSQERANLVLRDLALAAEFTKTSVESLAVSYNRVALATKDLGLSSDAVLGLTTALQQSFRLSGATIAESAAATIQLSQGLSSGQLRGQELRSVLEQNAVFADILSRELGVTRGQLIKFAESGKITSDIVLNALSKNFVKLNEDAGKLNTTIEQSVTVALDKLRFKLDQVNQEFGLTQGVTRGIELLVNNLDILGAALIGVSVLAIPRAIAAFKGLALAISANPIGLALVALSATVAFLALNWDKSFLKIRLVFLKTFQFLKSLSIKDILTGLKETLSNFFTGLLNGTSSFAAIGKAVNENLVTPVTESTKTLEQKILETEKALAKLEKTSSSSGTISRLVKALSEDSEKLKRAQSGVVTIQSLNKAFLEGAINSSKYSEEINKLNVEKLNKQFKEGKVDLDSYQSSLVKISEELQPESALFVGTRNFLNQVGTVSQNIAGAITQTFSRLEDTLVEFTKTGRFEFSKFTIAILEDINRIIIRSAIVKPLANAVLSSFGNFSGGGTGGASGTASNGLGNASGGAPTLSVGGSAKGNLFNGGVKAFAAGGIVNSPTLFSFNGNRAGLMGEAGPEAILPLSRTATGELGVKSGGGGSTVNINVINNAGAEVETNERTDGNGERFIDIVIVKKVKEAIDRGQLDRTFSQSFGLSRRGA